MHFGVGLVSVLWVFVSFLPPWVGGQDVSASVEHLKELSVGEGLLIKRLDEYIAAEEERLSFAERFLEDIEEIHEDESAKVAMEFIGHPINAFNLVKRFLHLWGPFFTEFANFTHVENMKQMLDPLTRYLPQETDRVGALKGILRLQKIYKLPAEELVEGWVLHKRANPLGARHIHDLATAAFREEEDLEGSLEWVRMAKNSMRPPGGDRYKMEELEQKVYDEYTKSQDEDEVEDAPLESYEQLCLRSLIQNQMRLKDEKLHCQYQPVNLRYNTYKMEVLQQSPEIYMVYDILTDKESDRLMDVSKDKMVRATTGITDRRADDYRVAKGMWIWNEAVGIGATLRDRLALVTGLNVSFPVGEPTQVVNYGLGGHYSIHHDFDMHRELRKEPLKEIEQHGDRMATAMIYLNEVEHGGATVFPLLNLAIKPVKNAAVIWYNYSRAGQGDVRTLHGACPVLLGEKWIANKWIREFGQEFRRPCGLEELSE